MRDLIFILVVGLVAGWLAGKIMKGKGFGLWGDLVVGVVGAVIGGWLFGMLGFAAYGLVGSIVVALIGALILLYVLRLIKK
ncbi:MAG: GlsB/YeaQ/YmgE family stress response membrane protein [bacterium]